MLFSEITLFGADQLVARAMRQSVSILGDDSGFSTKPTRCGAIPVSAAKRACVQPRVFRISLIRFTTASNAKRTAQ